MSKYNMHVPVFLPDSKNYDFKEITGVAQIDESGEVTIKFQNKSDGLRLAEMHRKGKLIRVAFDYIPDEVEPEQIPETPEIQLNIPEQ